MTRETKIGLLVGLAFIIVIGILLSDHMTSVNEPPLAPLQLAGNNVRSGLGQPTSDNAPPVVITPPNVSPSQTVLTRDELNPRSRPVAPQPPITVIGQNTTNNNVPARLTETARQVGEEIVDPNGQPITDPAPAQPVKTAVANTYKAAPGDSLSKIAARFYGTGTRANIALIIAANPSLKDNPNRIIIGKSYVIPAAGAPAAAASPVAVLPVAENTAPAAAKPTNDPEHIYVVQEGDTLWSIARDEVGNAGAVAAIQELNTDVLKGTTRVRPNMKLRLPAKPVASAN